MIKVGEKYKLQCRKDSSYGHCWDIIAVNGQMVTVLSVDERGNVCHIRSEKGSHCCEIDDLLVNINRRVC